MGVVAAPASNTGHQSTHHQQKVREPRAQNRLQSPSARSPTTSTTARPRKFTAPLLLNKRVRGVVHAMMGNGLLHLRPRVHLQRDNQKPASLSASAHRHFLPSIKALSGKKELAKHSLPRLATSTIPRKRRETRLKGDKRRACTNSVFDKEARQLQRDSSLILPHF
jgi:hypothetical protein